MQTNTDYYEILGVDRQADAKEIKKAYRRMARKHHPDINPGDPESESKFKEISEAYEILSDPDKRARYDQFGHAAFKQGVADSGGAHAGFGGIEDLFDQLFGGMGGFGAGTTFRQRADAPQRGQDLHQNLTLEFEDAFNGTTIQYEYMRRDTCDRCKGSGSEPGSSPITCPSCGGSGMHMIQQGFFTMRQTCTKCGGTGRIISEHCKTCNGKRFVQVLERIEVKVPAGVDTGSRIRLGGKGDAGLNGGPPGNLYLNVEVREHDLFVRRGDNIYCDIPITFAEASLGAQIQIPTVGGRVNLKVPAGTQSGKVFRLRGKGFPHIQTYGRGDMYVTLNVAVPTKLDRESRDLIRELEERNPLNPRFDIFKTTEGKSPK